MGKRKQYSLEPVLISIELADNDSVSHESGISEDAGDRLTSRDPSANDLQHLYISNDVDDKYEDKLFTVERTSEWCGLKSQGAQLLLKWLLFALYNLYLIVGVSRTWSKTQSFGDGIKLLVLLTALVYFVKCYQFCLKDYIVEPFVLAPCSYIYKRSMSVKFIRKYFSQMCWFIVLIAFLFYALSITSTNRYRLVSASGIAAFVLFGFALSEHRKAINWNQVLWGLSLQFALALLVLRSSFGSALFHTLGQKITEFLAFTNEGSGFVFDYLAKGLTDKDLNPKLINLAEMVANSEAVGLNEIVNGTLVNGTMVNHTMLNDSLYNDTYNYDAMVNGTVVDGIALAYDAADTRPVSILQPVFAFRVLPVILFFSFFVSILYYYGLMQMIVEKVGWLLETVIGTTAPESLNAAANIFLGMTEAPLVIKPYVPLMTKSELFAVMTGGFATIAGAVMAAYMNFGVDASHLLAASVMAAPSALGYSKLFYPETEATKTKRTDVSLTIIRERNALEAAANGASQAIKICSNIAANLIAFLAFIKFLNTMCQSLGSCVDCDFVTFEWILSKLFVPVALMMGVEWNDCGEVAKLIGLKTIVNEFFAYAELARIKDLKIISNRSITIATFALCGFSNFSSIGITLGALGSMVPERKSDLAGLALKAMIAGTTVTLTSACMAGLLVDDP